jgi:hypothetical protein
VELTKDMLTIRDIEVRELTERMEAMDVKLQAERHRKNLMEKKMQLTDKLTVDLKAEYKAQKEIFDILKGQYKDKVGKLELELIHVLTSRMDMLRKSQQIQGRKVVCLFL